MKVPCLVLCAYLAGFGSGCGSDAAPGTTGNGGSGSAGSAGTNAHAGAGAGAGGSSSAGAGGSSSASSAACQMFCDCHEKNCSTSAIPDGKSCAAFCAAMTPDQLTCRQNMCGLVPAQPNNNHCKHSLGIDECL